MTSLTQKIVKIEGKVTAIESVFRRVIDLEKKVNECCAQVDQCKTDVCDLKQMYDDLMERHLALDAYGRRENLLFHGVTYHADESCSTKVKELMKSKMGISPDAVDAMRLQRCHRVRRGQNSPIMCRFVFYDDRSLVWGKRFSLKGSKVFISENFPPEIEEKRKKLYPIVKIAKSKKMKATINYDRLSVDGVEYTEKTLHTLPPELMSTSLGTESVNVTCFFTGASPLSNFHVIHDGFFLFDQTVKKCGLPNIWPSHNCHNIRHIIN